MTASDAIVLSGQQQGMVTRDPLSEWEAMRAQATALVKSGFLPRAVDTPEKAIAIMQTGRELGIGPMQALRNIHIIDGKPTMAAELIAGLVLARVPGALLRVSESTSDLCTVEAARPGQPPTRFSWTIQDAQKAGLTGKQNWRNYPRAMLRSRCIAEAARAIFPDATMGMLDPDELGAVTTPNGEVVSLEPARIQRISPHIGPHETGDELPAEDSPFDDLQSRLLTLEARIDGMLVPGASPEWQTVLDTRFELGSGQRMSQLLKDVQAATEANRLVPNERKVLSAAWQRINRKLCKVEKTVKRPDVTASFSDPPEGEEQPPPVAEFVEMGDGYIEPRSRRREPGED